jgi:hypothetical protein
MRADDIRKTQRAQPFVPFTLHLADGREFLIRHPELMFVSRNERTIILDDVQGSIEILDPILVVSLSMAGQPSESASS